MNNVARITDCPGIARRAVDCGSKAQNRTNNLGMIALLIKYCNLRLTGLSLCRVDVLSCQFIWESMSAEY